ncbi:MAG: FHIPEP family type III secretion protein [Anaeromyxobacter sp.]
MREGLGALRERLWRELGVALPGVALREAPLGAGTWRLLVDEAPAAAGRAPAGEVLALAPADELALAGLLGGPGLHPATGAPAVALEAGLARRAGALGPVLGPLDRVAASVAAALALRAHDLVGVQEAQALLDGLEPSAPALVREAARQLPPALLAEVLRRLLEEGVSIRPLRTVLEAMLEAGGAPRGAAALAEACRRALRRHIAARVAGDGAPLTALLLDPAAEQALRDALPGPGAGHGAEAPALDPALAGALLDRLDAELRAAGPAAVVLAGADVRRALRQLVAPRFPRLPVLSCEELPPELPVRPVGRLGLPAAQATVAG